MREEKNGIIPENKTPEITKTCSSCRQPKPLAEFYNKKKDSYGKDCYCKKCRSRIGKRWHRKNKKHKAETGREWWKRVKDVKNVKRRERWKLIKDVINAKRRKTNNEQALDYEDTGENYPDGPWAEGWEKRN